MTESRAAEKDLGTLVDMGQQHVLAAQKANLIPGCMDRSMARRLMEVVLILLLCLSWGTAFSSGAQDETHTDLPEQLQGTAGTSLHGSLASSTCRREGSGEVMLCPSKK